MQVVGVLLVLAVGSTLAGCASPASTSVFGTATPPATATTAAGATTVRGSVTAGPVCPVERPGDSSCAPRPVAGATIRVTTSSGTEVARATTTADGSFSVELPAGDYVLVPQPVEGLLGTAEPMAISVRRDGSPAPSPVQIQYDTGIR